MFTCLDFHNKILQTEWHEQQNFFFFLTVLEASSQVPPGSVSGKSLVSVFQTATFSMSSHGLSSELSGLSSS